MTKSDAVEETGKKEVPYPKQNDLIFALNKNDEALISLGVASRLVLQLEKLEAKEAGIVAADKKAGKLPIPKNPRAQKIGLEIYAIKTNLSLLGYKPNLSSSEVDARREELLAEKKLLGSDYLYGGPLENALALMAVIGRDWLLARLGKLVVLPPEEKPTKASPERLPRITVEAICTLMAQPGTNSAELEKRIDEIYYSLPSKEGQNSPVPKPDLAAQKKAAVAAYLEAHAKDADLKVKEGIFLSLMGKPSFAQKRYTLSSLPRVAEMVSKANEPKKQAQKA